jgi:hypothetical protein
MNRALEIIPTVRVTVQRRRPGWPERRRVHRPRRGTGRTDRETAQRQATVLATPREAVDADEFDDVIGQLHQTFQGLTPVSRGPSITFRAPYAGECLGACASRSSAPSMAFEVPGFGTPCTPPSPAKPITTPQASLHATERSVGPLSVLVTLGSTRPVRRPSRQSATGPPDSDWTGLSPASDDELTTEDHLHQVTSGLLYARKIAVGAASNSSRGQRAGTICRGGTTAGRITAAVR